MVCNSGFLQVCPAWDKAALHTLNFNVCIMGVMVHLGHPYLYGHDCNSMLKLNLF